MGSGNAWTQADDIMQTVPDSLLRLSRCKCRGVGGIGREVDVLDVRNCEIAHVDDSKYAITASGAFATIDNCNVRKCCDGITIGLAVNAMIRQTRVYENKIG